MDEATRVFYELYEGLPRCGPGDDASTRRAYETLEPTPVKPRILDLGCGTGAQTLELARLSHGHVLALDNHEPFLKDVARRAEDAGLAELVTTTNQSMHDMSFEPGSFDIVWSEGALYFIGFQEGLRRCSGLLRSRGFLAVTELVYLSPDPPATLEKYWERSYPDIHDVDSRLETIQRENLETLSHFTLPESSWWGSYYDPLQARIGELRKRYPASEAASKVFAEAEEETDLYRKFSEYYGYEFFIMRKRA
jgi:SAM-dependent methyltransferase